jgi:hypothetical protein
MSKATKTARNAVANTLLAITWILGLLTWLGALVIWNSLYGLMGVLFGLLTISDLLLPFAWHNRHGYWPLPWILAAVVVIVLAMVATAIKGSDEDAAG